MVNLNVDGSSSKNIKNAAILFMGLGHILYLKEYVKGVLFALVEAIALLAIPTVIKNIVNLITLGEVNPNLPVKLRDNSTFMLIEGIVTIVFIFLFIMFYIISVKSALESYKDYCQSGKLKTNQSSFRSILGKSFPLFGLLPTIIMILFFVIVPLVFSACVAFTNYGKGHIPPGASVDWVGFDNFINLFNGQTLWTSALARVSIWTLVWAVAATFTCYFGGFIIAAVLKESKLKIAPVFRGIFILPYAIPSVITMLVWRNLLNGSFGVVNNTLRAIGILEQGATIPWLGDASLAKFVCVLMNLWAGFPYFMLLTMGSMTAISEDVYDAAKIDGASALQTFKSITFPLVRFQTMPLIIMSFTHNINNFGAIFFLTGGDPKVSDTVTTSAKGTDILITWIYDLTINKQNYSMASVLAVMIFLVLAPFAIFNFRRTKSYKEGEL